MAIPTNTFATSQAAGNREDLSDGIAASNANAELGARRRRARFMRGKHTDVEEMAKEFASLSPDEREELLDDMEDELKSQDYVTVGSNAMHRMADNRARRRVLKNVHQTLRRAGK